MRQKIVLLLLLVIPLSAETQTLEFSGYFENQFFPQRIRQKWRFQDYNKLRLDISAKVDENISFNGDLIFRTYHGLRKLNGLDFIPQKVVEDFLAQTQWPYSAVKQMLTLPVEDEYFLDNAYVTIYTDRFNLRIGKQQLPWGTGYTWNPTDLFHVKNMLDPTYEKTGVNAFKLEIPFLQEGMLTTVIGIGEDWASSVRAVKVKEYVAGFDVSVSIIDKRQASPLPTSFSEKRRMVGMDFSGSLFGCGVWGEGAYNFMERSGDYGQYLFGLDYTFESGLYLISEYYQNGLGKTSYSDYTFADWLRLLGSAAENLGQHYIFAGGSYPIGELWNGSTFALVNLDDRSGVVFPWVDYSLSDNAELILVGYLPFGRKLTEFGEFGAGGFARVRVYF